jgi:hypothetical protein
MPAYVLGEQYKQRVDSALAVVEGIPSKGGMTLIPTRFESIQQQSPNPVRLAAYNRADWLKGTTTEITYYTHSGTSFGAVMSNGVEATATALNLCCDFYLQHDDPGPTPTMTWCVVGKSRGGAETVIEGPHQKTFRVCTFTGEWPIGSQKAVTIQGASGVGSTMSAVNMVCGLKPAGECEASVARVGPSWYLVQPNLTQQPGYSASGTQVLTIQDGSIKWVEALECETTTSTATASP